MKKWPFRITVAAIRRFGRNSRSGLTTLTMRLRTDTRAGLIVPGSILAALSAAHLAWPKP